MTIRELWGERFGLGAPRKIICVGLNYRDHAAEGGREAPGEPLLFAKLPTALIEPGEAIVLPPEDDHVDSEAELAVVIGLAGRRIRAGGRARPRRRLHGRERRQRANLQRNDGQWLRAKSFDTFCPVLPALVGTEELGDASGLRVTQRLNGEILQDANTDDFLFDVPTLIAHASAAFTLEPGDLILTGTPSGVGVYRDPPVAMQPGDRVEVEVERIGVLANPVAAAH